MLKKLKFLVVILFMLFVTSNAEAATYHDQFDEQGVWISNEFVNKEKDGRVQYQQMSMILSTTTRRFLYCIEPGVPLNEDKILVGYDTNQAERVGLTPQQWERIKLLAYYGYGYKDHMEEKWYVITQFMIWQTHNLGYDIYFTDTLNGKRIEKYTTEMQELENLINSHYTIPNFSQSPIKLFLGETKKFTDQNNVLADYKMTVGNNIDASTQGNKLTVTSKSYGDSYLLFEKNFKRFYSEFVVYIDDEGQDLLLPGDLDPISTRIDIKMNYGTIKAIKVDSDKKTNIPSGKATLEGAKYGLYNEENKLLEEQYTDILGNLNFKTKLSLGRYYIQEISPSKGYQLDKTKYYFNITADQYNITLNVYEKVIEEKFEIIKILENDQTGLTEFEKDIEFEIYDEENRLLYTYKTDDFGTIKFTLPYGVYILRQKTAYEGYEKIEDYIIEVSENERVNKLVFKNNKIKKEEPLDPVEKVEPEPLEEDILVVEVPNTLKNDFSYFYFILLFIFLKRKLF